MFHFCTLNVKISLGRVRFVVLDVVTCDGQPASLSALRAHRLLHLGALNVRISLGQGIVVTCM